MLAADLDGFREAFPTERGVLQEPVFEADGRALRRAFAPDAGSFRVPGGQCNEHEMLLSDERDDHPHERKSL